MLKSIFKDPSVRLFSILTLMWLLSCGCILLLFSKSSIHLYINQYHNDFFDIFFRLISGLGNGWTPVIFAVTLLWFKFRHAILIGLSASISGIIVQLLKAFAFSNALRPISYFGDNYPLHLVPGVEVYSYNSLPSGHTTTAFALFLCLSVTFRNKWLTIICFLLAILTAYSRMYLSQHFMIDVFWGSIIGTATALIFIYLTSRIKSPWIDKSFRNMNVL